MRAAMRAANFVLPFLSACSSAACSLGSAVAIRAWTCWMRSMTLGAWAHVTWCEEVPPAPGVPPVVAPKATPAVPIDSAPPSSAALANLVNMSRLLFGAGTPVGPFTSVLARPDEDVLNDLLGVCEARRQPGEGLGRTAGRHVQLPGLLE